MLFPREALIVNADDLGVSPGVNQAIVRGALEGGLTDASLFANGAYFEDALNTVVRQTPLRIGLHANLTEGRALSPAARIPLLAGPDGRFRHGFMKLWLLSRSARRGDLISQARLEMEAQIGRLRECGITVAHIDGHRHVHMIPALFPMIRELAGINGIDRIRDTKEFFGSSWRAARSTRFLRDGGLIKYGLLNHFSRINAAPTTTAFFSILYTCRIETRFFPTLTLPRGCDRLEVMLHPGMPEIDRAAGITDPHLLSPWRTTELETALALK
jgi:predicted glycoside hydrolase/deacetylase ChbG (UPF0249 family)